MDQLIADDPARIGPYRLIARLGEGGMGLVYLGRDEGGRTVAVKVVQAEYAGHHEFRRRFAREVAAARRVDGSWTAAVLDADPEAAVPWVATRYIPGPDLHTVVAKDFGPLPEYSVRVLAGRLALALQAVHKAGLIHRDLKPSNVLVTVDGPRVIDFGIARAMDSLAGDSLHTRTGMLIGSPGFMSPEQVRGLELTPASDVFCLGAVLVHAATGRLLFGATETGLNAHLFRVAEEEADLTGVPESLVDLVRACLHKDPAERPTPSQVAERAAPDRAEEWLPGAVLAQLGRNAAQLLDFAPAPRAAAPADDPADAPAAQPDPRIALAQAQARARAARAPVRSEPAVEPPPPPAYAPTALAATALAPETGPPSVPHPGRWWGFAVIVLAQLTVLFEATTFNLALPYVRADLHLDLGGPFSLPTVRGLAFGAVLLLGGHLADLVGRRRTLIVGLAGFAVASVLGGAAPTPTTLTMAFALQGVFAALLTPSALALVSTGFTDRKERRRALGIYVAISVGGTALTMPVAGSLMEQLDWRVCEYAAVPLAMIALAGALTLVHDRPGGSGASFDLPGVLLGCGAVAALTVGLDRARTLGWTSPLVLALLVAGPLLLAAFWRWQTRASSPLVAPYVLKDRSRVGGHLALVLSGAAVFALTTALDFHLRAIRGYAPAAAGLAFLPLGLAIVVGATQVSARLLDRTGPRALIVAGLVTAACGLALLTALTAGGGYATQVLPGMLLGGVGLGTAFMPLFALATDAVAPQHSGGASAAVTTTQQLGPVLGSALLSALFATRLDAWPSGGAVGGSPAAFGCAAAGALLAALLAGLLVTARKAATGQPARR